MCIEAISAPYLFGSVGTLQDIDRYGADGGGLGRIEWSNGQSLNQEKVHVAG